MCCYQGSARRKLRDPSTGWESRKHGNVMRGLRAPLIAQKFAVVPGPADTFFPPEIAIHPQNTIAVT